MLDRDRRCNLDKTVTLPDLDYMIASSEATDQGYVALFHHPLFVPAFNCNLLESVARESVASGYIQSKY
jgi:hypothetical protein